MATREEERLRIKQLYDAGKITGEEYTKQYKSLADTDAVNKFKQKLEKQRESAKAATQKRQDEIRNQPHVKMWTGSGFASVNPAYVSKREQEGWTTSLPSQSEIQEMIKMAQSGSQGTWSPSGGVGTVGGTVVTPNKGGGTITTTYKPAEGYNVTSAEDYRKSQGQTVLQQGTQSTNNQAQIDILKAEFDAKIKELDETYRNAIAQSQNAQTQAMEEQIKRQAELQLQQSKNELERAYNQSMRELDVTAEQGKQMYEAGRTQTRTQDIMRAKQFEDFLAQRGISSAGVGVQEQLQRGGQTQQTLTGSMLQEQQLGTDIARQRAQLGSDLQFGTSQAEINTQLQQANQIFQLQQAEQQRLQQQQALQEQRAYEERLMQMGWAREDAQLESQRAYNEQIRQQELELGRQEQSDAQARTDFNTSILANYNDLQAYYNTLQAQGAPQWQLDAVMAARNQKIAEQNLDPVTGRPLPQDTTPQLTSSTSALQLWQQLGTANEAISRALGVPVGARYTQQSTGSTGPTLTQNRNYAMDLWRALGRANETVAQMLGIPVGTPYGGGGEAPMQQDTTYNKLPDTQPPVNRQEIISTLYSGASPQQLAKQIALWSVSGRLRTLSDADAEMIDQRMAEVGITEAMMNQAVREIQDQAGTIGAR